jgi:hypothetical protein
MAEAASAEAATEASAAASEASSSAPISTPISAPVSAGVPPEASDPTASAPVAPPEAHDSTASALPEAPTEDRPCAALELPEALCDAPPLMADPFCGHGTVLAMANAYGCDAYGVDLNPNRAEAAAARRPRPEDEPLHDSYGRRLGTMSYWAAVGKAQSADEARASPSNDAPSGCVDV